MILKGQQASSPATSEKYIESTYHVYADCSLTPKTSSSVFWKIGAVFFEIKDN